MSASLTGVRRVPGDKAISHRAALLAATASGTTVIRGFSTAGDCAATLGTLTALGVHVARDGDVVRVEGRGAAGLARPHGPVDCVRSGTTMRLLSGVVAGARHVVTLTGDEQLLARPMRRVAGPLRAMGASVTLVDGEHAPMTIAGGDLTGIDHSPEVSSAQVKSAVLIAGIQASGVTRVREAVATRDHTERLLTTMGARIRHVSDGRGFDITVERSDLQAVDVDVPGDISSAAPLIAAAVLVAGSDLGIAGVGLNPLRTGFIDVLARMGASIERDEQPRGVEPAGDLRVRHGALRGTTVGAAEVPSLIDELPLLALVATQAEGETVVRGAAELRVKESDRISGVISGLRALGADAEELDDGFVVRGPARLRGAAIDARGDHRLAMTFSVAALCASGEVRIGGPDQVGDSFPEFHRVLLGSRA